MGRYLIAQAQEFVLFFQKLFPEYLVLQGIDVLQKTNDFLMNFPYFLTAADFLEIKRLKLRTFLHRFRDPVQLTDRQTQSGAEQDKGGEKAKGEDDDEYTLQFKSKLQRLLQMGIGHQDQQIRLAEGGPDLKFQIFTAGVGYNLCVFAKKQL